MAICGIDLGTTNSLIALFSESGPKIIPNVHGESLTPSAVGLDEDGTMIVGKAARDRLVTHPDKTAASFKRFMGTAREINLGDRHFRAEELSAFVLRSLKADAEAFLNEAVSDVVISVPAYFNDPQRKATIDAGRLAGLNVVRIVNEPTAAALAYGFGEAEEGKYLIFDLGGGTFDVSILDKFEGVMEVRATTGDTQLGGNDFTLAIERAIAKEHGLNPLDLCTADIALLRNAAETIKIDLTRAHETTYSVPLSKGQVAGNFSRDRFETELASLMRRLRAPLERAIADARLSPEELDAVILVGGATRVPLIRSMVARLFQKMPLVHLDPDTTIALGAAIQAGLCARAAALEDVVMTDVCPHTLGIDSHSDETDGLVISPIIERNAIVPISRTKRYQTISNRQRSIEVGVYQGENIRPEDNVALGTIEVPVPPAPAGQEKIDVCFTYDVNGALEVVVSVVSTGISKRAIFKNSSSLSEAELERRFTALSAIKLHPREQMENKAIIARAERLYANQLGLARDAIKELIGRFLYDISSQHVKDPGELRDAYSAELDMYERSVFDE